MPAHHNLPLPFRKPILNNSNRHRSHAHAVKIYKMWGRYSLGREESIYTMSAHILV